MIAKKWKRINKIYHEALMLDSSQRKAFVVKACADDEELRREIEALLASHERASFFLETPAAVLAAKSIAANSFARKRKLSPARVFVTISKGPREGKTIVFTGHKTCVFGRANDSFEILPEDDRTIGRHHFSLEIHPPRLLIQDLQSRNGTFVNGRRIGESKRGETLSLSGNRALVSEPLNPGDRIQAGNTMFTVDIELLVRCICCGRDTDLYSASIPKQDKPVVLCRSCWGKITHGIDLRKFLIERNIPSDIRCSSCGKGIMEQSNCGPEGSYLCNTCREKMVHDKRAIKKLLDTTSHSEERNAIYSIKNLEFKKSLGRGKVGNVYLAKGKALSHEVAVKIIVANILADAAIQADLKAHLETMRNLSHPNVVGIMSYGFAANSLYLVSEYCDGGNVRQFLARRNGRLGLHEAIPIMLQFLEGLAFIHSKGLFHGDLTPENLLLSGSEETLVARLSDACLLHTLQNAGLGDLLLAGKSDDLFFSPQELLTGIGSASPASDVWSLAAIFYYMLSGQFPQDATSGENIMSSLIEPTMVPIAARRRDILPDLAQLIDDSLQLNPARRPQNAGEMLMRLRKIQGKVVRLTIAQ